MAPLTNELTRTESNLYPGSRMSRAHRGLLMLSLCLLLFLAALDVTIVSTALPTIAVSLSASSAEYAWVGSAYTLASTSMAPIWAKFSDIAGRKSGLMGANLFFMAGSAMAGAANTAGILVGGRVLQGLGSGGMFIIVTIVIGDLFELKDRAKYYGMTGIVWAVAGAVGPVMGGAFTQTIGWRWCFWINLPFCVLSLVSLFYFLRLETPSKPILESLKTLDWIGSIIIVGGTICFLYGLESGSSGQYGWSSPLVIALIVVGIVLLATFVVYEGWSAKNPLMPGAIFADWGVIAMFILICAHSFVIIAYSYFLPLYFQVVLKFSPLISGAATFPLIVPMTIATYFGGVIVNKTGDYFIPIWASVLLLTLGSGLLINLGETIDWARIVCFQMILGLGAGCLFQAPMIVIQSQLPPKLIASAMSALGFLKNLATSCSVVIGTVLLQSGLGSAGSLTHGGAGAPAGFEKTYISALRIMWIFFTCVCFITVICALGMKRENIKNKRDGRKPAVARTDEEKGGIEDGSVQVERPDTQTEVESGDEKKEKEEITVVGQVDEGAMVIGAAGGAKKIEA